MTGEEKTFTSHFPKCRNVSSFAASPRRRLQQPQMSDSPTFERMKGRSKRKSSRRTNRGTEREEWGAGRRRVKSKYTYMIKTNGNRERKQGKGGKKEEGEKETEEWK